MEPDPYAQEIARLLDRIRELEASQRTYQARIVTLERRCAVQQCALRRVLREAMFGTYGAAVREMIQRLVEEG